MENLDDTELKKAIDIGASMYGFSKDDPVFRAAFIKGWGQGFKKTEKDNQPDFVQKGDGNGNTTGK